MKKVFSIALLSLAFIFSFSLKANASSSDNIVGWAWSANAGWISFNCTNDATCGTSNYGINKNADGTVTGYAWSTNVGWIKFGGLSGFPSGSGTYAQNAQFSGTALRGWIQAIGADGNTWDGWISLVGTTPTYGVTQTTLLFSGYAWGGDVLGWIQFDPGTQNPGVCPSTCDVRLSGDANFDIKNGGTTLSGNNAVPYGTIPTYNWDITTLPSVSCSLSKAASSTGTTAFSTISGITASGTTTGSSLLTGTYTFNFDCTNPTINRSIGFTVAAQPPGFSLGGNDTAYIQFLGAGTTDSEQKNIFVTAFGGYTNPVTITITGVTPALPASTTMQYSLGGGAFVAYPPGPTGVVISSPYVSGTSFKARVIRQNGAPSFGGPYTVTITGTGAGAPTATESMSVTSTSFVPIYREI